MNPSKLKAFSLGELLIIDSIYLIDKCLLHCHLSSGVSFCKLYLFKELISPFYLDYQFMAIELFIILLYYPFNLQGVMALFFFSGISNLCLLSLLLSYQFINFITLFKELVFGFTDFLYWLFSVSLISTLIFIIFFTCLACIECALLFLVP